MSIRSRLTLLVAVASLAHLEARAAAAQPALPLKFAGKPTQTAITPADAMTRLYIFADDSMMGRRTGEPGGLKATAYIERELRRLDLVPGGEHGTFFQPVPLYTRTVDRSSRLRADSDALEIGADYEPLHPGGNPRRLEGAQVIFVGNPADTRSMIAADRTVGKIVATSGTMTGLTEKYPDAAGYIIVRPDAALAQVRRFEASRSMLMKSDDDTASTAYTLFVAASASPKFLGVPIANARPGTMGRTLNGDLRYNIFDAPARNVIAIIRGSDPKLRNEFVAIGAHIDHLGLRRGGPVDSDSLRTFNEMAERVYVARTHELPDLPGSGLTAEERAAIRVNVDSLRKIRAARPDSIYNGADDDGSGSVGLLEIAERFAGAKARPKRSMIFVWHTGEEEDLYGSTWFTDHPTVLRDSIIAQLNLDMIGRGEASDIPGGGPGYLQLIGSRRLSNELGGLIEAVNRSYLNRFKFDYQFDAAGHPEQYYCRSDHYEYARYGIPITFFSTGGHVDYHQVTDEPQYINYPHLAKVATLVADVAERVANLDHRVKVDKPKPDPNGKCVQ